MRSGATVITDSQRDRLWSVVEEWVQCGGSVTEFKREAAECWEQALRDRLRDEPKELMP